MVKHQLLVGAAEFWSAAAADIAGARDRVLVQAMTFEADAAGTAVFDAIAASTAADRRILVDSYSRMVVNDRFVLSARRLTDPTFRAEVRATRLLFRDAGRHGVAVRRTNPVGRNPLRYGVRNHKKLLIVDDIAYLGGLNFSDHNFAWHDMMVRMEDATAAAFLADDFAATWTGTPRPALHARAALTLAALDGRTNHRGYAPLADAIAAAQRSIVVISPYPSFPFMDWLDAAARRGVAVQILTPRDSNKPIVRDALLARAPVANLTIRLTPGMTHLKAMLIDDSVLVTGSTNFDFASYVANEEYLALIRDEALVTDFSARVLDPAHRASEEGAPLRPGRLRGAAATAGLRIAAAAIAPLARARRTVTDWD